MPDELTKPEIEAIVRRAEEAQSAAFYSPVLKDVPRLCRALLARNEQCDRLRESLKELTDACIADNGNPDDFPGDDGPVGATQEQHGPVKDMALTFGMLRRALALVKP